MVFQRMKLKGYLRLIMAANPLLHAFSTQKPQTMNTEKTNHENGNDANRLLVVVLISLVWMAVLTVGVILAWLFDGGEFFIRTILLLPFSFGGIYASRSVWKHYR